MDFQTVYHLDIELLLPTRSWRWFEVMVAGLAARPDSLFHRFLTRDREEETSDG